MSVKNKIVIDSNNKRVLSSYSRTQNNEMSEEEILKKVGEYKENIYRNFFKHVNEEKMKENKRVEQLKGVKSKIIIKSLERQFGLERAMADEMLKRENDKIIEKVGLYENSLRRKKGFNKFREFNY